MEINVIYNENCLETMARMPDGFIDLTVTSPPYNKAGLEGFVRKRHSRDSWRQGRNIEYADDALNDFLAEPKYQSQQIDILNELYRVTKEGGSLFYNHKNRTKDYVLYSPWEWLAKTKWKVRQEIIWDRGRRRPLHLFGLWQTPSVFIGFSKALRLPHLTLIALDGRRFGESFPTSPAMNTRLLSLSKFRPAVLRRAAWKVI